MKHTIALVAFITGNIFFPVVASAQSNQEMLQYLIMQQKQQEQVQQPPIASGLNEQQWQECMHNAWVAGQLAPKHSGNTMAEGDAQAAQYQQSCGPRPQ